MLWFGGEEQGVEGDRMECVRVLSLSGKGSDKWQSLMIFNMEVIKFLHKHNFQFTVAEEGFQAWDTLQNSTDNSSIDKAETSFDWQEYNFHAGFKSKRVLQWVLAHYHRKIKYKNKFRI